ncbi:hypothetical protein SG34_026340 [Thalassomonas viridans]|uniref:Uncharacterized protein n=1 Tax=Thalassomonas viridans TaxID=137584 RepID=A0AAE9Z0W5_9GAMM|nr:hypothetical protein [Thalassomonas viridans]WDE04791.1 hypothetical protein SG34_026340 [Thalassomonas viridans]
MASKIKLTHHNKAKERPPEGTPEFEAWLKKRSQERAAFYFDETREVPELDPDTRFLCGSWDFLNQTDEDRESEDESMEKADEERKRSKLKLLK